MADKPESMIAVIIFVGFLFGSFGFLIYTFAKEIDKVRHVQLSNCTAVDAHLVWDLKSGESGWVVHVNASVPASHNQPPHTTHTMSLLKGTHPNDNYFTNQTFPCYASTRDSTYVALTPQKPEGINIFGVILFAITSFLLIIMIVSAIVENYSTRTPPNKSRVREVEQIRLARVDTASGTSSNSCTTIVAPSDLEAYDLASGESSETTPFVTKSIVAEAAKTNMKQIALDESTGGGLNKNEGYSVW
jgi:hypothetical protein